MGFHVNLNNLAGFRRQKSLENETNLDKYRKLQAIHREKVRKHQRIFKVIESRCFLMKVAVNYHYRQIRNKKRKKNETKQRKKQ